MSSNKYAYLIIADRNKHQLQKLITMLDDSRNDIYLLVDGKSSLVGYKFHVNYSTLYYLKPMNIYWGSYSIIQAELNLFKASYNHHYAYYHLISGQDLPLVNQDIIHNFFDKYRGYEFIQYQTETRISINDKLNYHIATDKFDEGLHSDRSNSTFFIKLCWSIFRKIESFINIIIPETDIPYNKVSTASQWISIDDKLVNIIIQSSDWLYSKFHRGKVVDELFIPTLINYYPKILNKVYDKTQYSRAPANPMSNLRYIKKRSNDAHPGIFTMSDYKELIKAKNQGFLFSRKFDETVDDNIINNIFNDIIN